MVCKGLISFNQLLDFKKNRDRSLVYLDFDCGFFCFYPRSEDEESYYPLIQCIDARRRLQFNSLSDIAVDFHELLQSNLVKPTFVGVDWDTSKRTLTLATGTFGIIPLYYYYIKNQFVAFANDIPGLLEIIPSGFLPTINKVHTRQYLSMGLSPNGRFGETFYNNIECVPPGNSVTISDESISQKTFLKFDVDTGHSSNFSSSIAEKLKQSVFDAVGNGNRIAAHLSGGLDSSAISAFAQHKIFDEKVKTFYFDLQTHSSDELTFVNKMIDMYNFDHTTVVPGTLVLDQEIDYIKVLGRPGYGVFPSIAHASVMSEASANNCNVLLSGHDGDSVMGFGLYDFFDELYREQKFSDLNHALDLFSTQQPLEHMFTDWENLKDEQKRRKFREYWWTRQFDRELVKGNLGKCMKLLYKFDSEQGGGFRYLTDVLRRFLKVGLNRRFVNPGSRAAIDNGVRHDSFNPYHFSGSYTDAVEGIYQTNSLDVSRDLYTLGNAYNISVRFPFLNKELFEMSMAVPLRQKFGNGIGRDHLRAGLIDILPDDVRLRMGKGSAGAYSRKAVLDLYRQGGADFMASGSEVWNFLNREIWLASVKSLESETLSNMESVRYSRKIYRAICVAIWLYKN